MTHLIGPPDVTEGGKEEKLGRHGTNSVSEFPGLQGRAGIREV
jgi:hypothetical protein